MQKVAWKAAFEPAKAGPGQVVTLKVTADIASDWHIYGQELENKGPIPTTLDVNLPEGWELLRGFTPSVEPRKALDPGFNFEVTYHEEVVDFTVPVRIGADAPLGETTVAGRVQSQACDANQCLPPFWNDWQATIQIVEASEVDPATLPDQSPDAASTRPGSVESPGKGEAAGAAVAAAGGEDFAKLRTRGLFAFLVFAALAGFASLLTPCVFPMIPITVSFFTKRSDRTPRQGVGLAVVYALGIVIIYSTLGLVFSAVLGIASGASGAGAAQWIAANPWINLFLAALFVFFALSLFGLFDIQLPPALANKLQRAGGGRADVFGALIMAFVFTITSFTCTVQFVGLLLVEAARGDWLWPGIGMVVYSAAFASPFFALALFPQALARLPRSGPWLHSTKVLMGFLEIAAAFKFISNSDLVWSWNIFNREFVLAAWVAVAFFAGLYLLGKINMKGEPNAPKEIGTIRMLLSMGFVSLGLYMASGLAGNRLHGLIETYLPPRVGAAQSSSVSVSFVNPGASLSVAAAAERLDWTQNYEEGLQRAEEENRPVFIDFTGVTCTNCRWMEINIFQRPEIERILEKFVLVQLYTDYGPDAQRYQRIQAEVYGTVALPFYVILSPDGEVVGTHGGIMRDPARFAEFLNQGLPAGG